MAITLTESAVSELKNIIAAQDDGDQKKLRISINGGGCSGIGYSLGLDEASDPETDAEYDNGGVKVVTNKKFALYLEGTTIDFVTGPHGSGFAIENPNQPKGGGCAGCGGGHY